VVTKTISEKKKCKKEKWLSEEVLQTVEKRKEMKIMGKTERYELSNCEDMDNLEINIFNLMKSV